MSEKKSLYIYKNGTYYSVIDESEQITEITHSALKALRDSGELKPGQLYRITDYTCTTTQAESRSAGHVFDIIVLALDNSQLSEEAWAAHHSGDTYFADVKVEAWKLWYCLDNDSTRFEWADTVNGKGVVYRMIDEWNNEAPYDFKNIQFKRYKITACQKSPDLIGFYLGIEDGRDYTIDSADFIWCYTFNWINESDESEDCSVVGQRLSNDEGQYSGVYNNSIKECTAYMFYPDQPESFAIALNNIVIQSTYDYEPGCFYGVYGNKFGNDCCLNTFGDACVQNIFENECIKNTFGNDCHFNIFGHDCSINTFGHDCFNNQIGNNFGTNTFGNNCHSNTFGNNCQSNTFGSGCDSNTFGNDCASNTFEFGCHSNTFGNDCHSNTFGNNCQSNTFGNDCNYITFGNFCNYNTFGDGCSYIIFGTSSSSTINYCRYIIIDNGCSYIGLSSDDESATSSNYLQNVYIHSGVVGASSANRRAISVSDRNLLYSVDYYANNSQSIILND